ncbi:hypothetical protein Tco_0414475 [Tanacetum coccineum]
MYSRPSRSKGIGFPLLRDGHRAIPQYMPWRHPGSCVNDLVPKIGFNPEDVKKLGEFVVKLRNIPMGVLVILGLSRAWWNHRCDPVIREGNNVDGFKVQAEAHGLSCVIQERIPNNTTLPDAPRIVIPTPRATRVIGIYDFLYMLERSSRADSSLRQLSNDGSEEDQASESRTLDDDDLDMNDRGEQKNEDQVLNVLPLRSIGFDPRGSGVLRIWEIKLMYLENHEEPEQASLVPNDTSDRIEREIASPVPSPYYLPYLFEEGERSNDSMYLGRSRRSIMIQTIATSLANDKEKSKGRKKLVRCQEKTIGKLTTEAQLELEIMTSDVKDLKKSLAERESELLGLKDKLLRRFRVMSSDITKMMFGIEESHHGPSDASTNLPQPFTFLLINSYFLSRRLTCYLLTFHSEKVDIENVAVNSSLRSLKPKRTNRVKSQEIKYKSH